MAKKKKKAAEPLTIVCWLYPGPRNYQPRYVNVLYRQVQQFLPIPHRFLCIYDDLAYSRESFDEGIELLGIPPAARELLGLKNLNGTDHPACYARLWHFSDEAADIIPGRMFMFDVDSIPVADMTGLATFRPDADFVSMHRISGSIVRPYVMGGSWLYRCGSLPEIWDDFIADPSAARESAAEWFKARNSHLSGGWLGGSDQAWLSYKLVPKMSEQSKITFWPEDCGILLYHQFAKEQGAVAGALLQFNGHNKPWGVDWPLTARLYGARQYEVIGKPLRLGSKTYQIGERLTPGRATSSAEARALVHMNRLIEVNG